MVFLGLTKTLVRGDLPPDAVISELKTIEKSKINLRSGEASCEEILFRDQVTDKYYSFSITSLVDGHYLAYFGDNVKDSVTLNILSSSNDNCVIEIKYKDVYMATSVTKESMKDGSVLYSINDYEAPKNTLRVVPYESWWSCVKRISLNDDVAMGGGLGSLGYKLAFPAVVAAAGVICRDMSIRRHWEDGSPGEIRSAKL